MSKIQFDEINISTAPNSTVRPQQKGIIGLVIKLRLAKNTTQANLLLIGLIVVLIVISFFSLRSLGTDTIGEQFIDPGNDVHF